MRALSPTFPSMLTMTFGKWLDVQLGLSAKFTDEVAFGFPSTCYASDVTLHAFAGKLS